MSKQKKTTGLQSKSRDQNGLENWELVHFSGNPSQNKKKKKSRLSPAPKGGKVMTFF